MYFAIYWVGLGLRKFRPDFASNSTLHCLDYRPAYHNFAKGFFDKLLEKHPFTDVTKLTTKKVYNILLQDQFAIPRIHTFYTDVDFDKAYRAIHNNFIDPEVRGFAYKLLHNVVPTNLFLFHYTSQKFSHCTFCGKRYEETIRHLFIDCPLAQNVWTFVQHIFWKMANHGLKITEYLVRFNELDAVLNKAPNYIKGLIFQIINLAKYSIWCTRCEVKDEHRSFDQF